AIDASSCCRLGPGQVGDAIEAKLAPDSGVRLSKFKELVSKSYACVRYPTQCWRLPALAAGARGPGSGASEVAHGQRIAELGVGLSVGVQPLGDVAQRL